MHRDQGFVVAKVMAAYAASIQNNIMRWSE